MKGDAHLENLARYLECKYGLKAKEWENEGGDKAQFSILFYQMIDALESIYGCTNVYVQVAMHKAIAQDEIRLQDILARI